MMQVSQTVWRLLTQGPLSRMRLPPRSSAKETWRGWWISPTQCPRYLSDASFAASSFDVRKTFQVRRDGREEAFRHSGALAHRDRLNRPGHVDEVLLRALPRMIGPRTRVRERVEVRVQSDQSDDFVASPLVEFLEGDLADDSVANAREWLVSATGGQPDRFLLFYRHRVSGVPVRWAGLAPPSRSLSANMPPVTHSDRPDYDRSASIAAPREARTG
jgi:hypothetical protein